MFDYKLLDAFINVMEKGSFEKAASYMGLTQSAVSQRIKLLEARVGHPVLIRGHTLQVTESGQKLLSHSNKVKLLENELANDFSIFDNQNARLRIAINADSISTWWFLAASQFLIKNNIIVDIVLEDQDHGLKKMKEGDVSACICTIETPLLGSRSAYLGELDYGLFSSASFFKKYFPNGMTEKELCTAPAIVFGINDELHNLAMKDLTFTKSFPYHICPSSEGILKIIESGLAYGVLTTKQGNAAGLHQLKIKEAMPRLHISLYWHYWRQGLGIMEKMIPALKTGLAQYNEAQNSSIQK